MLLIFSFKSSTAITTTQYTEIPFLRPDFSDNIQNENGRAFDNSYAFPAFSFFHVDISNGFFHKTVAWLSRQCRLIEKGNSEKFLPNPRRCNQGLYFCSSVEGRFFEIV